MKCALLLRSFNVAIEPQAPIRDELPFSLNSTRRASTYVRCKYLLGQLGENLLTSIVMGNKVTRRCSTVDERYTRLQGLYPQRGVDQKKLRRLILDSKLAPCFPGEEEANADFEECPICFLSYPSLNRSKCCSKGVCTECFLQMKSPRTARSIQCPFCKSYNYGVEYRGVKSLEEKGIEAAEEQKVIEAKIRMRKREILDDEHREQRKEEGCHASRATTDVLPSSRLLEPPQQTETPPQESATSGMSDRSSPRDDLDSLWICEEYGSEGSLAPTPAPSAVTT